MRLDITGRHVEITPAVRQLISRRLGRLERMLNDAAVSAIITLTKEKYRLRTEIAVHTKGDHVLRGNGEGNALPQGFSATPKNFTPYLLKLEPT